MADDRKTVEVEVHVWAMINFAAKVSGMTESEVVEAAIVHLAQSDAKSEEATEEDPEYNDESDEDLGTEHEAQEISDEDDAEDDAHWDWQTVHMDYMGHRAEALFNPVSEHVRFTADPFAPAEVLNSSEAASRVMQHFNPDASRTEEGGRQLWILTDLGKTIADVYG